jgi:hypothetical protein
MIVKASTDTAGWYGAKKSTKIVFKDSKMVKGEGLVVLKERMKAVDTEPRTKSTNFSVANKVTRFMSTGDAKVEKRDSEKIETAEFER